MGSLSQKEVRNGNQHLSSFQTKLKKNPLRKRRIREDCKREMETTNQQQATPYYYKKNEMNDQALKKSKKQKRKIQNMRLK